MKFELPGAHAVVTGGAKGIGAATARRLAEAGAAVSLLDVDGEGLAELEDNLRPIAAAGGGSVVGVSCDITKEEEVTQRLRELRRQHGAVTILVNNAGTLVPGDFLDQPMMRWEKSISVNLTALIRLTHAVLPDMYEANRGVVVNISSASGALGVAGLSVYAATKWAVWGFTESLRHEAWNAGKGGVHFASVHPSFIRTGLFAGARIKRLGGLIVPLVKDHDVIAKAIVRDAIERRKNTVYRPRSVRIAPFLRGVLPDRGFQWLIRALGVDEAMRGWKGE